MLSKEQIYSKLNKETIEDQFVAFFQPQYNNYTGMIVGAEALSRWIENGELVCGPSIYIPVIEEKKLISFHDLHIFEEVCKFQKKCIEEKAHLVPISVNLSREDIYKDGFLDELDAIREKYDVPAKLLRLEVTESVASGGKELAEEAVNKMHSMGYVVELDDFGSGYSSLNILKDIDYDILKLDMGFISNDTKGKGGTILSSVVRMAKWLEMPVIAEGIETIEQLSFMKSIGCEYTQGYYFAKPMPASDFEKLINSSEIGFTSAALELKGTVNPTSFWNDSSLDTFVFNNYVGAASVFRCSVDGKIEVLRVNTKYVKELGMNMSENDIVNTDMWSTIEEASKETYKRMLEDAIATEEEQECETWRLIHSDCCGDERLCIRSTVSVIGKSKDEFIFYESIRNITTEKRLLQEGISYEGKFKNVLEQANIYYWEYTVATKEMRPCFRCMRDLGLPPLVTNYPEPAIEQGIFPADYADMYRDWHVQIANGVDHLEAVIPLTVGRVPFHVRYTTEFDELGRPIKAYGSATLVTDAEMESFM